MQAPGCRFTWSPRLLLLELLPPSGSGCGSFRYPSCSFHPAPAWFSLETSASWVLTVASAPDSERTFAFGRSLCSVSGSTPSSLVASWCGGLGACLPIFPFPFPLESFSLQGSWTGSWRGSSLRVVSSFSFGVALSPLWRWQAREAVSCGPIRSSGRLPGACSSLSSSPLMLPGVVLMFPVCLPRAPALRQVLVAMLAEGALESPSVLVLAFHSSLFLVEGSSDGSAPGDRFLSPGRMCSFTPFRLRSVASALSLPGSGLFFLLWICRFTVGSSGAFPRGNFWGSREGWVFQFSPWLGSV